MLLTALLLVLLPLPAAAQGRYAPPAALGCERNDLTVYIGEVTRYARRDGKIEVTVKTSEDTIESSSVPEQARMLIDGQVMKKEDWARVERKAGELKAGMRLAIWVCRGSRTVLDWRPPQP